MSIDPITVRSALSQDACRRRISQASRDPSKIVGYALPSQVDVTDDGERFKLQHKLEPVIFTGTISCSNSGPGSVISGDIEVPGQSLCRVLLGFVCTVAAFALTASICDLFFRTNLLLTRSRTELGTGHPAMPEEHWAVLIFIPLVALPIIAVLWRKARGVGKDARQTLKDSLQKLFGEPV